MGTSNQINANLVMMIRVISVFSIVVAIDHDLELDLETPWRSMMY